MANLELKIDSPVVSTILAEKYLEKYKKEIAGIRNKTLVSTNVTIDVVLGKKELSNKIIGNAELFCHLESFIRNKPVEDVKNIDLKLIENCLLDNAQTTCNESVVFCDNTPLAVLGQISFMESKITIYCTDKTVAVCHLFMQLCHQTGFTQVSLRTTPPDAKDAFDKFVCAGVVTEKSDIDSAIDAFLSSTSEYPWKLQQILVQESVYDTFKKAVEYKSKLGKHTDGNVAEDLKRLCSELYVYKKKIFLFDYVGNNVVVIDNDYHRVRVEAYRTTRELLSMLQNVTAMSLWSSDLSEAHEIAIEAPSLLSWVNGFGNVKGSPRSSRWLTSFLNSSDNKKNNSQVNADVLMKSFKSWSKIDGKKDRMNTLAKGVEIYKEDSSSDKDLTGKCRRVSLRQLDLLWKFLNSNRDIASAYNRSSHDKYHSHKKWSEITKCLNAIGDGCHKDWRGWSKYWVDFKAKLKKRVAVVRASRNRTGASSTAQSLTEIETKFLSVLGQNFGKGLPSIKLEENEEITHNDSDYAIVEPKSTLFIKSISPPPEDGDTSEAQNHEISYIFPMDSSAAVEQQPSPTGTGTSTRTPSPTRPPASKAARAASPAAARPNLRRKRRRQQPMTQEEARRALVHSSQIRAELALRNTIALERIAQNTQDIRETLQRLERIESAVFLEANQ